MRTVGIIGILSITALLIVAGCNSKTETKKPEELPVPVTIDSVHYSQFQVEYHSIGRVMSDKQVNLLFQTSGQVDSVWVQLGQYVKRDQKLARIKPDVYQTMYAQAKSMYEKAKRDLESSKKLYQSNVISSDQYEQARIGLDNARAGYTQAKNTMENTVLQAPFSGWIVSKNLNVGDLVAPGAAMQQPPLVIADMERLNITIPVPESRIGQVKPGQSAEITFKTFPGKVFEGRVVRMGLAPKDFSNNYDVEVELQGDISGLKLGLVADVKIVVESYDQVLVVPLNLIQDDGNSKFLFTAEDGRAVRKDLTVKGLSGSMVYIEADVHPGDILIVRGQHDLRDGTLLDVVES